jgi:hypothetical protein
MSVIQARAVSRKRDHELSASDGGRPTPPCASTPKGRRFTGRGNLQRMDANRGHESGPAGSGRPIPFGRAINTPEEGARGPRRLRSPATAPKRVGRPLTLTVGRFMERGDLTAWDANRGSNRWSTGGAMRLDRTQGGFSPLKTGLRLRITPAWFRPGCPI